MVDSAPTQGSGRKLFYGLFIFPLIIAVGMAVMLCTVVLLTSETVTPESLITEIKTGTPSKRWQKAFELSNELNQGRGLLRESGVMKEVIHILMTPEEYDPKTRSYMAMALSHFDEPEVVPSLRKALKQETSPEVQLFIIWALGSKQAKAAEEDVLPFLRSDREDLRKMAAYTLGVVGSSASREPLAVLLSDRARDVRWNAAISLARLGSDEGYNEILKMLDRRSMEANVDINQAKVEEIMISAIKGATLLGRKEVIPYMEALAEDDKSLKVRQAAIESLKILNS